MRQQTQSRQGVRTLDNDLLVELLHAVCEHYLTKTSEHLHQRTTSESIPEPQILDIRQVLKRMLLTLLLIHRQRIPPSILPPQHNVQDHRNADQDSVTADDTLPDARVVVDDLLRADPEWADDIA